MGSRWPDRKSATSILAATTDIRRTLCPTAAEFREIVEPERLVLTWGDEDTQPAVITVTFAEHGGGTRLTFHLVGPADMVTDESGVQDGWCECLDSLQLFLARKLERR